jgi:hypothetical protein
VTNDEAIARPEEDGDHYEDDDLIVLCSTCKLNPAKPGKALCRACDDQAIKDEKDGDEEDDGGPPPSPNDGDEIPSHSSDSSVQYLEQQHNDTPNNDFPGEGGRNVGIWNYGCQVLDYTPTPCAAEFRRMEAPEGSSAAPAPPLTQPSYLWPPPPQISPPCPRSPQPPFTHELRNPVTKRPYRRLIPQTSTGRAPPVLEKLARFEFYNGSTRNFDGKQSAIDIRDYSFHKLGQWPDRGPQFRSYNGLTTKFQFSS